MRIHGATPEWMEELKSAATTTWTWNRSLPSESTAFPRNSSTSVQGLGYKHPDPDELVAMRIHNVTPEYISQLRSRGMHDLSIDQLVSMRIHGID